MKNDDYKFQRGYRVRILSRLSPEEAERRSRRNWDFYITGERWENAGVGEEAIVESSNSDNLCGYENDRLYALVILYQTGAMPYRVKWFEEKYLELICCNEAKGEKILKEIPPP